VPPTLACSRSPCGTVEGGGAYCLSPPMSTPLPIVRRGAAAPGFSSPGAWREIVPGNDLLSHTLSRAVPSALRGLTAVFGMGTGVSPSLMSPGKPESVKELVNRIG
jgi:hypothetical protein